MKDDGRWLVAVSLAGILGAAAVRAGRGSSNAQDDASGRRGRLIDFILDHTSIGTMTRAEAVEKLQGYSMGQLLQIREAAERPQLVDTILQETSLGGMTLAQARNRLSTYDAEQLRRILADARRGRTAAR